MAIDLTVLLCLDRTCGHGLFKLYLNGCEHCDKRTERFTCGGADGNERQLLAEIQHVRDIHDAYIS